MNEALHDRRVLVLGLGISGRSAAAYCAAHGAQVVAADEGERDPQELDLPAEVDVRTGAPFPDAADFDLVVPSPGVPWNRYGERARRVWGDIELVWRALPIPIVAVTGTNGKSTTTLLIEALLRAAGLRAGAAGNVGVPALELLGQALDVAVLEVSSFQLEAVEGFRPRVAVLLNLSPDHLDRHGDLAGYAAAKARIFAQQAGDDVAVVNADDPAAQSCASAAPARRFDFSLERALDPGVYVDAGAVVVRDTRGSQRVPLDGLRLQGRQNLQNVAAALSAVAALGADVVKAAAALPAFEGLPHRSQLVAAHGDVRFVNDSKATNVGAALGALAAFPEPVVWIAGGKDKGLDFAPLADAAAAGVRAAVLLGETREAIARALGDRVPVEHAGDMDEAVRRAAALAQPGDVVLLAPACASFDQFRSYEHRGDCFADAVHTWIEENPA